MLNMVSDSSCDLRPGDLQGTHFQFHTVPLRIQVGQQEFLDEAGLSVPAMLAAMAEEKSAASTACPSPAAFARAFEQGEQTICFTISSGLSGTYNAAMMGRDLVLAEHPEKQIHVVDSRSVSGAMILLIRRAAELAESGADFETICREVEAYRPTLHTCFTLENFENLIKNGRMSPLAGTLLHNLGIHIIADSTPEGTIHVAAKARGVQRTYRAIARVMESTKDCTGAEVIITHCGNLDGAMALKAQLKKALPVGRVEILPCRGLTSFYAMNRGLIVTY